MSKLVRITDSTYDELAKHGQWNDTMDSIIQRLLHKQNNHGIDDSQRHNCGHTANLHGGEIHSHNTAEVRNRLK